LWPGATAALSVTGDCRRHLRDCAPSRQHSAATGWDRATPGAKSPSIESRIANLARAWWDCRDRQYDVRTLARALAAMVAHKYRSFAELQAAERELIDYRIVAVDRGSPVSIIAPHGGRIEPPTSAIATQLAANTFNLYAFEGLRSGREHHELHIT